MKKILVTTLCGLFAYSFICFFLPSAGADSQNLTVTGTVIPRASDFQQSITNNVSTVDQNGIATYTVTYGSNLYYADQITVEAQWYQGTIQGAGVPSIDGMNYVTNSASDGYNNTHPVIDLVNQKIDWTISSFPSQTTNQTVSFKLKMNGSYTGSSRVNFPVKLRLIASNFTTSDQTSTISYLYNQAFASTPTPGPTNTPTPGPTSTPIPTPLVSLEPASLSFQDLTFNQVSFDSITLASTTNLPTSLQVFYGTSPTLLSKSTVVSAFSQHQIISIENLSEKTVYYMLVKATDANGENISSDILTFKTGAKADFPAINADTVTFISLDVLLYSPPTAKIDDKGNPVPLPKPIIVVPQNTAYNFRFQVEKHQIIKRAQAFLRNKFVLGITTPEAEEPNTLVTELIEIQSGIFEGRLKTPNLPGSYEEFIRIYDANGNITEQKLADVTVSQPLRVYNNRTQNPIEAAQIFFYYYNSVKKAYLPLPPQLFPVRNPSYTDISGQLILPLPQGKYKAHITAIGYKQKNVSFTIGLNPGEDYPAVFLQEEPFNPITLGTYYWNTIADFLSATRSYIQSISYSVRFFELNALVASAFLIFLTLLAFSSRIHVPLRYLFSYFLHFAKITAMQRKLGNTIKGRVFDNETGNTISKAEVYLVDANRETVLAHTTSNASGDFAFRTLPTQGYDIEVMADGFEPTIFHESEIHSVELSGYILSVKRRLTGPNPFEKMKLFFEKGISLWFETFLVLSLLFELSLGYTLGWDKAILFIVFSFMNLVLWITHLTHLRSEKNLF